MQHSYLQLNQQPILPDLINFIKSKQVNQALILKLVSCLQVTQVGSNFNHNLRKIDCVLQIIIVKTHSFYQ